MERYEYKINPKSKDSLFTDILSSKEALLEVYNAVNRTSYTNVDLVEDCTLDDVIYIKFKNDKSFMLGTSINLYEHQSSINNNMPIRFLIYYAELIQIYLNNKNIYGTKQIPLHSPKCVVFYNGIANMPEISELRLSSAFMSKDDEGNPIGDIDVKVLVININAGYNKDILAASPILEGYSYLIDRIRHYEKAKRNPKDAIDDAIKDCIKNNKLKNYLEKKGSVAMGFLLAEYDEQKIKDFYKEEGRKEGIDIGKEKGRAEGREEGRAEGIDIGMNKGIDIGKEESKEDIAINALENKLDVHLISRITNIPIEKVLKMKADLNL
ncbi:hypothetical protein AN639_11480 [Candidatus Epulonipiscium fishelsonii]|uniref:Uncharacterized protein n=1 Tax=Candidatus Epulonipiscium fishelsonii TaxID=77094 RepID=A0ACC8X8D3_9FIRM|nr:hypothetical protein AN396_11530 [Epulopiscium sp. SCG-B11WGA-EpuloA1]ONI43069.1 hypothetical protein AN639_11480 [Epulopiscium sp. SCG-B05WGA-EpuloA1]